MCSLVSFLFRLVLMSNAFDGQSIYGFVTPKRKDALAKIGIFFISSSLVRFVENEMKVNT